MFKGFLNALCETYKDHADIECSVVHMSHVNQSAPLPQLDLISVQLICEKICTHLQNQFLAILF